LVRMTRKPDVPAKLLDLRLARRHYASLRSKPAGLRWPAINAALVATVAMDFDLAKSRHTIGQPVPDPDRDALERRRVQAFDLVQQAMIERFLGVTKR